MKRVLMTGAAGGVAGMIRPLLDGVYPELILSDRVTPPDLHQGERFQPADLTDPTAVDAVVKGCDGIIHLGGHSVEGPWETILNANIIGTYNMMEAARRNGVKRLIFASSNHAIGFYRRKKIGTDVTVRPDSRYGVSKAFGEAIGSLYHDKHGIGVTCLRIGNVGPVPLDARRLSIWLRPDDLVQLVRIGLEHPDIGFEIFYGASDNAEGWWNNDRAWQLGYRPNGRAEDHRAAAMEAQKALPADPVADLFQGGTFCSAEFEGEAAKRGG